jgi:hypothetical protein
MLEILRVVSTTGKDPSTRPEPMNVQVQDPIGSTRASSRTRNSKEAFEQRGGTWASGMAPTERAEGDARRTRCELTLALPAAGTYALGLQLRRDRDWHAVDVPIERYSVKITDREGQLFGLELAKGALAAAIAALRSRDG